MAILRLSRRAHNFIFDSVELLEALLMLAADSSRSWDPESVARELRSNANSIHARLEFLKYLELVETTGDNPIKYVYRPQSSELHEVVIELTEAYKMHRSRIVAMIFSPLKRARDIADAFRLSERKKK